MKAERRHELKQNTLARSLETLPDVGRRHGTKILLVVLVGLAVALLIRSRVASSRESAQQASYSLSHGRELVDQLRTSAERLPPTQFISVAQEISKAVDMAAQQVLEGTDDPRMLAEAWILRGDLNWQLATMPEPPGATTRPELALPRNDEQLLQSAHDAYQAALDQRGAPVESVTTSRLGLAAVAENRRQFDVAREHYQKVLDDTATPTPLKELAAAAISRLETIRKPPLLAPPATAPVFPGGLGALEPGTQPGMQPATQTQPATTPSAQPATTQGTPPSTVPATTPADAKPQAAPNATGTEPTAPAPAAPAPTAPVPAGAGNPG